MPNTAVTKHGVSLKKRIETAAALTARQTRTRREDAAHKAASSKPSRSRSSRGTHQKASASDERASQGKQRERSRSTKSTSRARKSPRTSSQRGAHAATAQAGKPTALKEEQAPKAQGNAQGTAVLERFTDVFHRHTLLVILVIIALCIAAIYPVGQRYYQTMRTEQRYEAQNEAIQARNAAIAQSNSELQTDEGIENEAHEQLGWTKKGEKSAVVTNAGDGSDSSSSLPSDIDLDSIDAPHTWYYDVLDAIFFVNTKELAASS